MTADLVARTRRDIDPTAAPDPFEAIRILGVRHQQADLSARGFELRIVPADVGAGWVAEATLPPGRRRLALEIGRRSARDENETERAESIAFLELRIKSDVGALELAGLSIAAPRPAGWADRGPLDRECRWTSVLCVRCESSGPTVALLRLRRYLALGLERRIRSDANALRERGVDFDLGAGWGPVEPIAVTVEGEGVEVVDAPRLPDRF